MNQIERILELTGGKPSVEDVEALNSSYAVTMLETLPPIAGGSQTKGFNSNFPSATSECRDIIKTLLFFNPTARPTAEKCLQHIYLGKDFSCFTLFLFACVINTGYYNAIAEFHNEEEEPLYPYGPMTLPVDDNVKLSPEEYRERLYQEITDRRKEARKQEQIRQRKLGNVTTGPV